MDGSVSVAGGDLQLRRVEIGYGAGRGIDVLGGSLDADSVILRGGEAPAGGLRAAAGTSLTVEDLLFETVGECAFELESDIRLDISNFTIDQADAGFCVPPDTYDVGQLRDRVSYIATDEVARTTAP